jgi:hypothetical protein
MLSVVAMASTEKHGIYGGSVPRMPSVVAMASTEKHGIYGITEAKRDQPTTATA